MNQSHTVQKILTAQAAFLMDKNAIAIIDAQGAVHTLQKDHLVWQEETHLKEMLLNTPERLIPISREQAAEIALSWIEKAQSANHLLDNAIVYATSHHAGQVRKGTNRPYILHPLETMLILQRMNADPALLAAGVLHDTAEDTDATLSDIRMRFGDDIAALVGFHSEDKRLSWRDRKAHAIEKLTHADRRQKLLVLADKVSNLRAMAKDHAKIGEALWERFNAGAPLQAWYYSSVQDAFWDMQDDPDAADIYWEMVALFKDLFVSYYLDPTTPAIYQICRDGSAFKLEKGNPQWQKTTANLPASAKPLSRKDAEATEEQWNKPFWQTHDEDAADAAFLLYAADYHCFEIHIQNKALTLLCKSLKTGATLFTYTLDQDATHRFLARMRIEYGLEDSLPTLLAKVFDNTDVITCFTNFCQRNEIPWQFKLA